jgi:hypothetical protein
MSVSERSLSRGRGPFVSSFLSSHWTLVNRFLQSTGRGGVGNIRQPSQSADTRPESGPDDFSVTRGREPIVSQKEASIITSCGSSPLSFLVLADLLYWTRRCRKYTLPISWYSGPYHEQSRGGCYKTIQEISRGCSCVYHFYIPILFFPLTVHAISLGF